MKKIMFNEKFNLTQAVLEGRKWKTRRIAKYNPEALKQFQEEYYNYTLDLLQGKELVEVYFDNYPNKLPYRVGEVVAIAQRYMDCGGIMDDGTPRWNYIAQKVGKLCAGWNNKMFVRADLMPNRIQFTDMHIEYLQEISDEDCLAEGIYPYHYGDEEEKKRYGIPPDGYSFDGCDYYYYSPLKAYASLINKISGKGTWEKNPVVLAYDFELVK